LLRAGLPDNTCTYKSVTAVAAAQKHMAAAGKVAVYVPYVKSATFMAQLVTADAAITYSVSSAPLIVNATTRPLLLGNTLAFKLWSEGGAVVHSAGADATAIAAEALRVARSILTKKGVEIGVVPQFAEGFGSNGQQVRLGDQQVPLPVGSVACCAPSRAFGAGMSTGSRLSDLCTQLLSGAVLVC
jgi:stage V sporulation protein SpoVS